MPTLAEAFAKERETFLRNHHRKLYLRLKREGELAAHLAEIGEEAEAMIETAQARAMNVAFHHHPNRANVIVGNATIEAEEVVRQELIFAR